MVEEFLLGIQELLEGVHEVHVMELIHTINDVCVSTSQFPKPVEMFVDLEEVVLHAIFGVL
jgi:hypothetical protein